MGTNLLFSLTVSHIKPLNEKQGCAHIKCSVVEGKQLTCFSSSDSVSYVIIGTKYPSTPLDFLFVSAMRMSCKRKLNWKMILSSSKRYCKLPVVFI